MDGAYTKYLLRGLSIFDSTWSNTSTPETTVKARPKLLVSPPKMTVLEMVGGAVPIIDIPRP